MDMPHGPDTYTLRVKEDISKWLKGKYYLRLYADENLKFEKVMEI
ncbi:MAG: hypothetical protein ABII90_13270 [Bacteroidota bacterium]